MSTESSGYHVQPVAETFTAFKTMYPSYKGDEMQFLKACHLLKRLLLEQHAPWPQLWDDFIYRHHHDYRNYLMEVFKSSDNAVPFEEYYTTFVERPQYLQRVIRPVFIDGLVNEAISIAPARNALLSSEKSSDGRDIIQRSIAASDSASNIPRPYADQEWAAQLTEKRPASRSFKSGRERADKSQASSVKMWLDEATGPNSPELGSPAEGAKESQTPTRETDRGLHLSGIESPYESSTSPVVQRADEAETSMPEQRWRVATTAYNRYTPEYDKLDRTKAGRRTDVERVIDIFSRRRTAPRQ